MIFGPKPGAVTEEKMQTEKNGTAGTADPKIVNETVSKSGPPIMSEAGEKNATHAGQVVDWKTSLAGDKK
jgi:hypothetical protein